MSEARDDLDDLQNPVAWLCRLLRRDSLDQSGLESLSPSDWADVARSANWHALAPLLYKRLISSPFSNHVPEETLRDLRGCYLLSLSRGILRMHMLSHVLCTFENEGIPVIPLKGAHLAEIIYGDPALRPMSDLDLLFRKPDLPQVVDTLTTMGYHPSKAFWIEYQCSVSHELPAFIQNGSPPIEVHWTIILPALNFKVDQDGLWNRSSFHPMLGLKTRLLSPEDLLLHLCMHAATQHLLRSGLRMTYDVAASLAYYQKEIDWDAFAIRAEQWNAGRATYLMLFLAKELFDAPMAVGFLEKLAPLDFDPRIMKVAKNLIFIDRKNFSSFSPQLAAMTKAKGTFARIRFIVNRLLPGPAEMASLYPVLPDSPKIILYYPVRMKDVLRKHLHSGLKLIRGESTTVDSARLTLARTEQENWLVDALTRYRVT
jgi:hypothetical protein